MKKNKILNPKLGVCREYPPVLKEVTVPFSRAISTHHGDSNSPGITPYGFVSEGTPLPPLEKILNTAHVISVGMRVTFRGVTTRHSALIRGPYGWGEFAPFPEYDDAEAAHWLSSALEAAYLPPTVTVREQVPVNATLPAVPAHRVPDVLNNYNGDIQELKIKVAERGQTLDDDIARVAAARTALPSARLKIDANAGWTLPQAFTALTALSDYNLLYAEQPVGSISDMKQLRTQLDNAQVPVLIAADELVRKADDPLTVARAHAADLIVVKAAPLGGVRRASAVIAQSGLPAVISSALETSVGIATGVHLAASLPELPYGCGLGTVSLLNTDVSSTPLVAENGRIPVRPVAPEEARLKALAADHATRAWWLERIERCWRLLHRGYATADA